MVGSASGPGSTFKAFLGSARVRVPLSNKIRVRVSSVEHIYRSLRVRVRILGPVKTSSSGYRLVSSKLVKMLGFKGYLPLPLTPTPRSKPELGRPLLSRECAKLRGRGKTEKWDSPLTPASRIWSHGGLWPLYLNPCVRLLEGRRLYWPGYTTKVNAPALFMTSSQNQGSSLIGAEELKSCGCRESLEGR